jgi:hypothetical protein
MDDRKCPKYFSELYLGPVGVLFGVGGSHLLPNARSRDRQFHDTNLQIKYYPFDHESDRQ